MIPITETLSTPIQAIVLFLAAFSAPNHAIELEIQRDQEVDVFTRSSAIWVSKENPDSGFAIGGSRLLGSEGIVDLSDIVTPVIYHSWIRESILTISENVQVLKTAEGLLIFPDGIRAQTDPIKVVYTLGSRVFQPPRQTHLPQ